MSKDRIYLDYASLTPIDPQVVKTMQEFSKPEYANPSAWYKEGVAAKKAMDEGRKSVANFLHGHADEIYFTSGGTEANVLALEGCARAFSNAHLIISEIEHSSIRETVLALEKQGVEVTMIGVDERGVVLLDELKKAIKPNTYMVSIMTVNNETGVIQPIHEIAKIVRHARARFGGKGKAASIYPLFHTDAAQAVLYQDLNVLSLGADLITLDGSKVYGPRGIGALWVRRNTPIEPIIYGGGQESGLRSGTENLPGIMGFAKALDIAKETRKQEAEKIFKLREYFVTEVKKIMPNIIINGGIGSPHIVNLSIPRIDNEFLLFQLDAAGIACSTKSSCLRDEEESYVLKAMGAESKSSLRFSFGRWTKKADITHAIKAINIAIKNGMKTNLLQV